MDSKERRQKPTQYMKAEVEEGQDHQLGLLLFRFRTCHTLMWPPCNFLACSISNQCRCRCHIQIRFLKVKFSNNNNNQSGIKTRVRFNREARTTTSIPKRRSSLSQ